MKDLISIIVPTYNNEKYIKDCLESLIKQTYYNIEIIVINDGSTDNTYNILKQYEEKDNRIKIINRDNSGVSRTRNIGMDIAKGQFITFVDADDWVETNFIEELYKCAIENNSDIVRCNYYKVLNSKKSVMKIKDVEYKKYNIDNINIPISNFIVPQNGNENFVMLLMIKNTKEKVYFRENIIYLEDMLYYFDLLCFRKNIAFLDKELYNYRINNNSVTNNSSKNIELIEQLFKVREMVFQKLDENLIINDKENLKRKFNGVCLNILCVRLGRYVRNGIKYTEYKKTINYLYSSTNQILKNYEMNNLNMIERVQIKLYSKKHIFLLYIYYKIKNIKKFLMLK